MSGTHSYGAKVCKRGGCEKYKSCVFEGVPVAKVMFCPNVTKADIRKAKQWIDRRDATNNPGK